MNEFLTDNLGILISALVTGSLTWVATIKWTRKQAEADAMESVQNVYQELIDDLKKEREDLKRDREELKHENQSLREELRSFHGRMGELELKCNENNRRIEQMMPYLCYCKNCPNRKSNQE